MTLELHDFDPSPEARFMLDDGSRPYIKGGQRHIYVPAWRDQTIDLVGLSPRGTDADLQNPQTIPLFRFTVRPNNHQQVTIIDTDGERWRASNDSVMPHPTIGDREWMREEIRDYVTSSECE